MPNKPGITHYLSTFPHNYEVMLLEEFPPGEADVWYFPGPSKRGGRDGLAISIQPKTGPSWIGIFAFGGFGGAITTVASTPDADTVCVVTTGEGYLVRGDDPERCSRIPMVPITDFRPIPEKDIITLADYTSIGAIDLTGLLWRTGRLSWDGVSITRVGPDFVGGEGRDPTTSVRPSFKVDLRTGEHSGGSSPEKYDATRQVVW